MKIKGRRQFKYSYNLLFVDWLDFNSSIKGKYRVLWRWLFAFARVIFEIGCIFLLPITLAVDIYRLYRTIILFHNHFERHWKPYVLQKYIEYAEANKTS